MSLKICTLASGSKGNSCLISSQNGKILIDAGLSINSLSSALLQAKTTIAELEAVFITHEHDDHIAGVQKLVGDYGIKVYANRLTANAIKNKSHVSINIIDDKMVVEDMTITPFRISHDAICPVGYTIECDSNKISYATDIGYASDSFLTSAKNSDVVLIECNHDLDMLMNGKYPDFLKRRIISNRGHLSNYNCAMAMHKLIQSGTERFILGHVSEENNLPELAHWTVCEYLDNQKLKFNKDYIFTLAKQNEIGKLIEL